MGAEQSGQTRPLRADARRNRDAVLEAASALFGEFGVETSLEEVARRAGVGIGTLYRHFPTREDLVFAVHHREVRLLVDSADEFGGEFPPDEALRRWMQRFIDFAAAKRGMAGALKLMVGENRGDQVREMKAEIHAAADRLLTAAAASGTVRADLTSDDLLRGLGGICLAHDSSDSAAARRLVGIVFDGMRYGFARPDSH